MRYKASKSEWPWKINVMVTQAYISWVNISLQKIAVGHTNCRCQAERQGPWTSCCICYGLNSWSWWAGTNLIVSGRETMSQQNNWTLCNRLYSVILWLPGPLCSCMRFHSQRLLNIVYISLLHTGCCFACWWICVKKSNKCTFTYVLWNATE